MRKEKQFLDLVLLNYAVNFNSSLKIVCILHMPYILYTRHSLTNTHSIQEHLATPCAVFQALRSDGADDSVSVLNIPGNVKLIKVQSRVGVFPIRVSTGSPYSTVG